MVLEVFKARVEAARKECDRKKEEKRTKKAKAWREWLIQQHEVGKSAAFQMVKSTQTTEAYVQTEYGNTDSWYHHLQY